MFVNVLSKQEGFYRNCTVRCGPGFFAVNSDLTCIPNGTKCVPAPPTSNVFLRAQNICHVRVGGRMEEEGPF